MTRDPAQPVVLVGANPGPVRALLAASIAVMVVDDSPSPRPVNGARYRTIAPLVAQRGDPPEPWVDQLVQVGKSLGERPLLFPMSDRALLAVARRQPLLEQAFTVVSGEPQVIELLLDKVGFATWAAEHGLPVPLARGFRQGDEVRLDDLPLPLVVKPSYTHELEHSRGMKLFNAATHAAASERVRDILSQGMEAVVQEDLSGHGKPSRQWSLAGITAPDGTVLATVLAEKLRQISFGAGTAVETLPMDEGLRDLALSVVRQAGRLPIFEVELRADVRGKPRVIEVNPRIWTQVRLPAAAGLDLLYWARQVALGHQGPVPQDYRAGVGWVSWRRDPKVALRMLRHRELDVRKYLATLSRIRVMD